VQAGTTSLFVNHPREAYELFATSAPDNTVKLWDVRSPQRCVRAFTGGLRSGTVRCDVQCGAEEPR
jgi:hypothetical protein